MGMQKETLAAKKSYEERKSLGQAMHRKVMDYFRQYMIVGGMPQAVQEYINTKDFKDLTVIS